MMEHRSALKTSTQKRAKGEALRAVLYLRLSESDDASTSIVRQRQDLRAYCGREGWPVVEEFVDDGFSGGKQRAKADAALDMLRRGDAEVLIVWKFDRFSRMGVRALADLVDVLDAVPGTLFVAAQDGLRSDNSTWRLQTAIMSELARSERDAIKMRVSSSMKFLRSVSRFSGGNCPFGYRAVDNPDGPGRVLVLDPTEAEEVQGMAARILAGESVYAVMRDLNERGVLTRSSSIVQARAKKGLPPGKVKETRWSIQALKLLLCSDVITGRVLHKGQLLRDEDGMPKRVWPSVLDIETVMRLRLILNPEKLPGTVRRRKHDARLLSGLVRCDQCGKPLYPKHLSNGRPIVYECSTRSAGQPCGGCSIQAVRLEEYIEAAFLDRFGFFQVFEIVESGKNEVDQAEIERSIQAALSEMAEDDADVEALSGRLQILKSRRSEAVRAKPETILRATGTFYADAWKDATDTAARRALLIPNVGSLTIGKGLPGRHGLDTERVNLEWRKLTSGPDNRDEATIRSDAERVAAVRSAQRAMFHRHNGIAR